MIFTKTKIKGVYLIELEPKTDERGYFERIYCVNEFVEQGINFKIVQVNQAMSFKKGTIRGPHMQKFPKSEDKLMQCIRGSVFDVSIDFRKESLTFGQWVGNLLSEENKKMVFVPKGIMHGYQALEDGTTVWYPVSEFYSQKDVIGIRWDDPFFKIEWPIKNVIASKIDKNWPLFKA
ncbi:MAG: dTDP-4-dehydrorhamnose 3,5-epimerase [bacterium]